MAGVWSITVNEAVLQYARSSIATNEVELPEKAQCITPLLATQIRHQDDPFDRTARSTSESDRDQRARSAGY